MVRHYVAVSIYSVMVYAVLSWVPTQFIRVYGWTAGETGLRYGLVLLLFGGAGTVLGGVLAAQLGKRGVAQPAIWVTALGIAVAARCSRGRLGHDPWTALTWYAPALLFMTLPGGTAIQVMQEAVPNRLRGQASAVYYLSNSVVGLTLGPLSVGLLTDYVYEDPLRIGSALALLAIAIAPGHEPAGAVDTRAFRATGESGSQRSAAQRPVLISVAPSCFAKRRASASGSRIVCARTSIAIRSVSTSSAPRRIAASPAAAIVSGFSFAPLTWLAMRVSTEPTNSAVTVVPCAASSARRHVDIARAANLDGLYPPMIGTATSPPADKTFAIALGRLRARIGANARHIAERPEVVHFHLGARGTQIRRLQQRLLQKLPGVVHQDRDVLALARGALDRSLVGHVELDGYDAIGRFRDEMRGALPSARPDIHTACARSDERADERLADAAIAAGDECYRVRDFHRVASGDASPSPQVDLQSPTSS